jgi:hypothetical protein
MNEDLTPSEKIVRDAVTEALKQVENYFSFDVKPIDQSDFKVMITSNGSQKDNYGHSLPFFSLKVIVRIENEKVFLCMGAEVVPITALYRMLFCETWGE